MEVFGNWWHSPHEADDRIDRLMLLGYDCLVVWESKFRSEKPLVIREIQEFLEWQPDQEEPLLLLDEVSNFAIEIICALEEAEEFADFGKSF